MSQQPVRVVVVLDGGLVQAICTLGVQVEVIVIDYDTDGADDHELTPIMQGEGQSVDAITYSEMAAPLHPIIAASIEHLWLMADPAKET